MECPASAVHFAGINYVIDTQKCTECGHCAEICPVSAITDTSKPEPAVEKHKLRKLACDLVVIGGGGAGLIAAVKAAHTTGKKVIVLEKANKVGGSTTLAHGFGVNYSKWHEAEGIEDIREELIKHFLDSLGDNIDEKLLRKITYAQAPFFDWLCEFGGAEDAFVLRERGFPMGMAMRAPKKTIDFPARKFENLKCEDQAVGPGWMGTYVIHKMMEQCKKLGIQVLTEYAGAKLLTDKKGKITGVLASDPGGQTQIDCKACVIATGCFSFNDDLIRKVCPEYFEVPLIKQAAPTCTGDGIIMAEEIGASIDYDHIRIPICTPAHHPFGYSGYRYVKQSETVIINLDGKRFTSEHLYDQLQRKHGNFVKQREGLVYAIMDEALIEKFAKRLIANPPDGTDGWILEKYREEIKTNLKNSVAIKIADTFEGLAQQFAKQFGTDPKVMVAELNKYNEFCTKGVDKDFGKDPKYLVSLEHPPYYAFYAQGFSEGTYGGIVTDENMQVLDTKCKIIPGLFAVGDTARGFATAKDYDEEPVSTLTWAVCSGYVAGTEVSRYLTGMK